MCDGAYDATNVLPLAQAHGYSNPVGVDHTGFWGAVTFDWIAPLLSLGARGGIAEDSASPFVPERCDAAVLARQFEAQYLKTQVRARLRFTELGSGM